MPVIGADPVVCRNPDAPRFSRAARHGDAVWRRGAGQVQHLQRLARKAQQLSASVDSLGGA
eukprot:1210892-Prymnesium_polylepis.3